jgi:hypothetical protein
MRSLVPKERHLDNFIVNELVTWNMSDNGTHEDKLKLKVINSLRKSFGDGPFPVVRNWEDWDFQAFMGCVVIQTFAGDTWVSKTYLQRATMPKQEKNTSVKEFVAWDMSDNGNQKDSDKLKAISKLKMKFGNGPFAVVRYWQKSDLIIFRDYVMIRTAGEDRWVHKTYITPSVQKATPKQGKEPQVNYKAALVSAKNMSTKLPFVSAHKRRQCIYRIINHILDSARNDTDRVTVHDLDRLYKQARKVKKSVSLCV